MTSNWLWWVWLLPSVRITTPFFYLWVHNYASFESAMSYYAVLKYKYYWFCLYCLLVCLFVNSFPFIAVAAIVFKGPSNWYASILWLPGHSTHIFLSFLRLCYSVFALGWSGVVPDFGPVVQCGVGLWSGVALYYGLVGAVLWSGGSPDFGTCGLNDLGTCGLNDGRSEWWKLRSEWWN